MNIVISVRTDAFIARLLGMPEKLRYAVRVAMDRLAIAVQRSVKEDKLSEQVLHVRTGTLKHSINQEVYETQTGIFATVGTNVKYGRIHEYGFNGYEDVRAHIRHHREKSRTGKKGNIIRGKLTGEMSYVSPHRRHMVMPERSFLRSTLKEFEPRIRQELKAAALSVLNAPSDAK